MARGSLPYFECGCLATLGLNEILVDGAKPRGEIVMGCPCLELTGSENSTSLPGNRDRMVNLHSKLALRPVVNRDVSPATQKIARLVSAKLARQLVSD